MNVLSLEIMKTTGHALRYHFETVKSLLHHAWLGILLLPLVTLLFVLATYQRAGWLTAKMSQEILAPSILVVACLLALVVWLWHQHLFVSWLVFLTAALFSRELHFVGTNNGIYLALLVLFWFLSKRRSQMHLFLTDRGVVTLLLGAMSCYFWAKTFDRSYWNFLPAWAAWGDHGEESLESAGHLCILLLVLTAWRLVHREECFTRGRITALKWCYSALAVFGLIVGSVYGYHNWKDELPIPPRRSGDLPYELSSLCPVQPDLGSSLYLASSDEQTAISLWTLDDKGEPHCLKDMPLRVLQENGKFYRLTDVEAIAWDGSQTYYAVTSHRNIKPGEDEKRMRKRGKTACAIVQFRLQRTTAGGIEITAARTITRDLLRQLREKQFFQTVDWTTSKATYWKHRTRSWQVDLEALEYYQGSLLLGFKNPVEEGRATILKYDMRTGDVSLVSRPNLAGQGILSLRWDRGGDRLLIVSNHPIKGRYGDANLWVAARRPDGWQFPDEPSYVIEPARPEIARKASGLMLKDDQLVICFDSVRSTPIEYIPVWRIAGW